MLKKINNRLKTIIFYGIFLCTISLLQSKTVVAQNAPANNAPTQSQTSKLNTTSDIKKYINPVHIFNFLYTYQTPLADLKKRFGNSSNIGFEYYYKNKYNFLIGVSANFIFGNTLRVDSLFQNLLTVDNRILNESGGYASLKLGERGNFFGAKIGKLFCLNPQKNVHSGILVTVGGGYFSHRIFILDRSNSIAQLRGNYQQGYDRLTAGWALHEYVGYMHLSRNKRINFTIGADITTAFTKNLRSYWYDVQHAAPTATRFDVLLGARLSWMLPIYTKKNIVQYYYK